MTQQRSTPASSSPDTAPSAERRTTKSDAPSDAASGPKSRVSSKPDSGDQTLLSAPTPAERYEEDIEERVSQLERARRDLDRRLEEIERAAARKEDLERLRGEAIGRWQVIVIAVVLSALALTVLIFALLGR